MLETPESMSICEVARRTGVRPSALRYYESMGILPPPRRVSGQRRYDAGILRQVRFIQCAQRAGLSLAEIKLLRDSSTTETSYSEHLQELARRKLEEVEALITQAQTMKRMLEKGLNCRCFTLEDCGLFFQEEEQGCMSSR